MKQTFNVELLTPYLSENFEKYRTKREIFGEMVLHGYNPSNFNEERFLETPERQVILDAPSYRSGRRTFETVNNTDLVIAGSTEPGEKEVRGLKDSGLIVARFSIFYGGPSNYTGSTPESAGYSLDIPKSVATVRTMLTDNDMLDALVSKEEARIRNSLDNLNSNLENPIVATPFLAEALSIKQPKEVTK
jgi:hypothetical protein